MGDAPELRPKMTGWQRAIFSVSMCWVILSVFWTIPSTNRLIQVWFRGSPPDTRCLERAELEQAGWNFPAWNLDETRLEQVDVVPCFGRSGPVGATFLEDGEGGGNLLLSFDGEWRAYDAQGDRVGTRDVKDFGGEAVRFEDADGTEYVLELRGEYSFSNDDVVQCLRDGEVLWHRRSRSTGWRGAGPIRLEDGRALVLLYDHDEWLALHPDGTIAWDRSRKRGSGDGHSTHPDLPGIYLSEYGDLEWRRTEDGTRVGPKLELGESFAYDAVAFPGAQGEPLAFSVGPAGGEDQGALLVVDDSDTIFWRATAPTPFMEVERIDRREGESLFVVTAKTGDLFVIDAEGTVLHHRTLPQKPNEQLGVAIYELDAGPLGPDHIGIAVTMLHWIAVYRLPR